MNRLPERWDCPKCGRKNDRGMERCPVCRERNPRRPSNQVTRMRHRATARGFREGHGR